MGMGPVPLLHRESNMNMRAHASSTARRRPACRHWRALVVGAVLALTPATSALAGGGHRIALTAGAGKYLTGGTLEVTFSHGVIAFDAEAVGSLLTGPAHGLFRQSVELGGLRVEFHGKVVCLTVDPVNNRAWIGGVVTRNKSEHPSFTTEIHQPGRDVWFRVLDNGHGGAAEPDRTTFLGFEGAAGIITSPEYCEAAIWPDDNARTDPITQGNILVRP